MRKTFVFLIFLFTCSLLFGQNDLQGIKHNYDSLVSNTTYGNNSVSGRYYNIRGFKMYCETYGTGEPLLLIHGNGGSISSFVRQIPYFAVHYKVIIADSRAQGKSVDHSDTLSYEMMADDYAALLTAMHIDSANVIGWSDGGINGLLLAIRHPGKVKKLLITGANLRPDSTAVDPDVLRRTTKTYNMFVDMFRDDRMKTSLDSTVYKLMKLLVEQPHIQLAQLHTISAPVMVVGGDHDVILPSHTLEIFENIPKAYLWILPNSGHFTLVHYADEFNKAADEFFRSGFRKYKDRDRDF